MCVKEECTCVARVPCILLLPPGVLLLRVKVPCMDCARALFHFRLLFCITKSQLQYVSSSRRRSRHPHTQKWGPVLQVYLLCTNSCHNNGNNVTSLHCPHSSDSHVVSLHAQPEGPYAYITMYTINWHWESSMQGASCLKGVDITGGEEHCTALYANYAAYIQ